MLLVEDGEVSLERLTTGFVMRPASAIRLSATTFWMTFDEFFENVTEHKRHEWQARLALDGICRNQLIRIPTGFGKTAGVVLAWLWNRVHGANQEWPRRLVFCLPMRTLVEQTERAVKEWLARADLTGEVSVHVLLGGLSQSDWHLEPERNAVLIGTQDMLLSRALNRGYGAGHARWPMEHGLLNVDCLWVMDEIQLMDVGLATSAQLQAFANTDEYDHKAASPAPDLVDERNVATQLAVPRTCLGRRRFASDRST